MATSVAQPMCSAASFMEREERERLEVSTATSLSQVCSAASFMEREERERLEVSTATSLSQVCSAASFMPLFMLTYADVC
jgi:hypothetical protein